MKKKKTVVATIDLETAKLMDEKVQKMKSTKSAFVRTAIKGYIEDGINTPALTFGVIHLVSEIEKLKGTIPTEQFERLECSVQNIINCMGGGDDGAN